MNVMKSGFDIRAFDVSPSEARKVQDELRQKITLQPLYRPPKLIAGADVSFNKYETDIYAGITVFTYPDLAPVERVCVKSMMHFPYIPGLLSFREIPPLLKVFERLTYIPDVIMVDGHGIAHSRRMGIAAHFGLVTNMPAIGCAKSLLYGQAGELALQAGSQANITDPKTGEKIGIALRTKDKVKPVFVSPGHNISFKDAEIIVSSCVRKHRLPEPTRLTHELVNAFRRGELADKDFYSWRFQ